MGVGSNVAFALKKPFLNLEPRARVLQIVRLTTGVLGIMWMLILLTGAFTNSRLYLNRLECAHVDVSDGLFTTLRDSVSSNEDSLADNYGPGLTASEIELLSDYTETKVEKAPQYIKSNVFNWCFGNYNITETHSSKGRTTYTKTYIYEYCTKHDRNYVYDYRGELETIGLNIILAYAYDDSSVSTVTDDNYVPDKAYLQKLAKRRVLSKTVSGLLVFSGFADTVIIILALLMYGCRGYMKNDSNSPMLLKQTLASLSFVCLVTNAAGVSIMTLVSVSVRSEIAKELGSFGISSHLGKAWFALAWISVACQFLNTCAWAGPVWCGAPIEPVKMGKNYDSFARPRKFHLRTYRDEVAEEEQHLANNEHNDDYDDEDMQELEDMTKNPFADNTTRLDTNGGASDDDSDTDPVQQGESSNNSRFRNMLRMKKNKKVPNERPYSEISTGTLELEEQDYLADDLFLTADDRFIMKRENLLLSGTKQNNGKN